MKTYVQYPPRKLQSLTYTGPITLSNYQRFEWLRDQLKKEGFNLPPAHRQLAIQLTRPGGNSLGLFDLDTH